MKFTFLGTGAAEAIPDPYCRCRVCEVARRERGPHIRARSSALVNDDLLIDLGPDLLTSANAVGAYLGGLKVLLVTHRHSDHWLLSNLEWRKEGFTPTPTEPMVVYGPADALGMITERLEDGANFTTQVVSGGDSWTAGGYTITAVPAKHGGGWLEPLLYVIDDGEHKAFYGTDTGPLLEEAWDVLRALGPMDLVALDATGGTGDAGDGHHSLHTFPVTRQRLIAEGVVVPGKTQMIAHHFSHNGHLTYDELVARYGEFGVGVSYDGMVVALEG